MNYDNASLYLHGITVDSPYLKHRYLGAPNYIKECSLDKLLLSWAEMKFSFTHQYFVFMFNLYNKTKLLSILKNGSSHIRST